MKTQETKPIGRPREKSFVLPIYESMNQCSGMTGIPRVVLAEAKREGCPAFLPGNRVELGALLRWLFSHNKDSENLDLNRERALLAREQRNALARENAVADKQLFILEEVQEKVGNRLLELGKLLFRLPKTLGAQMTTRLTAAGVSQGVIETEKTELAKAIEEIAAMARSMTQTKDTKK